MQGSPTGLKGGWIFVIHQYSSEMAQNFWTAIYAFSACVALTIVVSCFSRPRADHELAGLVYSLTPKLQRVESRWWIRPKVLAIFVLSLAFILNVLFW
ncbi:hypothetical protein [Solimonas terrae]|uniref:Uncharacterized protein n=1 Tax=Solimonas terrae TaxID=1396819 RepID=A0A6M2BVF1_9GAMM|nr:hypothetical protein [Solimonas terrae]NGY05927.1 hypothetical protein [Solimonas terrae]